MTFPPLFGNRPNKDDLDIFARFAYTYSIPTMIRRRDERGVVEIWGGSGLLMKIGGHKRLVTAHHVVEEFRKEHARDPATLFDCMLEIFVPDRRIIGEDPTSDLVVLNVEDLTLRRPQDNVPEIEFFEQTPLFGSDVNVGDSVFFGGWTNAYRDVGHRGMDIFVGYDSILNVPVTGISDDEIEVNFGARDQWQSLTFGNTKPED